MNIGNNCFLKRSKSIKISTMEPKKEFQMEPKLNYREYLLLIQIVIVLSVIRYTVFIKVRLCSPFRTATLNLNLKLLKFINIRVTNQCVIADASLWWKLHGVITLTHNTTLTLNIYINLWGLIITIYFIYFCFITK